MKQIVQENIIELAKLGHERAAELKASCGAVDVRSVAQLISDLATQLEVALARGNVQAEQLSNAESKCRELAAECSTIKVMNDCLSEELRGYESDGAFEGPKMHLLWWKTETPATDAFLAEVRAQGVESGINTVTAMMNHQHPATSQAIDILQTHAAQLRKGAAL
ncbi:hypothetical protein [Citrobacter braakii]|uniref:hypothetical protein n=1 Tax=Citrobacter braakii TaxID=57706 RepID=UPI00090781DD|nr:hypothetical protein [Citrobacter braakii]